MPNPREDETQEAFVSRCMGHSEARQSFPEESQRAAFCHSQWSGRHNMKIASILLSNVATRLEMFEGRDHLVVPVVALVEGVLNGLYYPGVEITKHPGSWNGIPVVIEHPVDLQGTPVSANTPPILEKVRIGHFFNVGIDGVRLKGEAWINIEKAKKIRPKILEEVHENLEVSTCLFGDSNNVPGMWEGINYGGTLTGFKPDHLALLFEGEGACNWQDGCGVRVNMQDNTADVRTYASWRNMIQRCHNENAPSYSSYGGKGIKVVKRWRDSYENFFEDMGKRPENKFLHRIDSRKNYTPSNCQWDGRQGRDPMRNEKGGDKVDKDSMVKEALKTAGVEGEKKTSIFKKMLDSFLSNFKANELAHDDIRMQLQEIVDAMDIPTEDVGPTLHYVQEVFDDSVIVRQTQGSSSKLFRIGFEISGDDEVKLKGDRVEVREETEFVPAEVGLGSQTTYVEVNLKKEDLKMAKKKDECCKELIDALILNEATQFVEEDRVWLDELPEDQIKKLSPKEQDKDAKVKAAEEKAAAEKKEADDKVKAAVKKVSEDKPVTTEEYIENAPEEMREVLTDGLAMHKAKKTQLVEGLIANKRNKFTKEQLEAKKIDELEMLAELAAVVVDFTTNRPRNAGDQGDDKVPDMPEIDWKASAEKK